MLSSTNKSILIYCTHLFWNTLYRSHLHLTTQINIYLFTVQHSYHKLFSVTDTVKVVNTLLYVKKQNQSFVLKSMKTSINCFQFKTPCWAAKIICFSLSVCYKTKTYQSKLCLLKTDELFTKQFKTNTISCFEYERKQTYYIHRISVIFVFTSTAPHIQPFSVYSSILAIAPRRYQQNTSKSFRTVKTIAFYSSSPQK